MISRILYRENQMNFQSQIRNFYNRGVINSRSWLSYIVQNVQKKRALNKKQRFDDWFESSGRLKKLRETCRNNPAQISVHNSFLGAELWLNIQNSCFQKWLSMRLFIIFEQGAVLGGRTPPPPCSRVLFHRFPALLRGFQRQFKGKNHIYYKPLLPPPPLVLGPVIFLFCDAY